VTEQQLKVLLINNKIYYLRVIAYELLCDYNHHDVVDAKLDLDIISGYGDNIYDLSNEMLDEIFYGWSMSWLEALTNTVKKDCPR